MEARYRKLIMELSEALDKLELAERERDDTGSSVAPADEPQNYLLGRIFTALKPEIFHEIFDRYKLEYISEDINLAVFRSSPQGAKDEALRVILGSFGDEYHMPFSSNLFTLLIKNDISIMAFLNFFLDECVDTMRHHLDELEKEKVDSTKDE